MACTDCTTLRGISQAFLSQTVITANCNLIGGVSQAFDSNGCLTRLNLNNIGFNGTFPADLLVAINNFTKLTSLDVGNNYFTGALPAITSKTLTYLDLSGNFFTGGPSAYSSFPSNIVTGLLSYNCLTGPRTPKTFNSESSWAFNQFSDQSYPNTFCGSASAGTLDQDCALMMQAVNNVTVTAKVNPFADISCYAALPNTSFATWSWVPPAAVTSTLAVTSAAAAAATSGAAVAAVSTTRVGTATNGGAFLFRRGDPHVLERRAYPGPGRLIGLSLKGLGISGSLPAVLGSLTALVSLDLSGNRFTGDLPSSFSQLTSLQSFDMAGSAINDASLVSFIAMIKSNGGVVSNSYSGDCQILNRVFDYSSIALTAFNQDCSNVQNNTYVLYSLGPFVAQTTTTSTSSTSTSSTTSSTSTTSTSSTSSTSTTLTTSTSTTSTTLSTTTALSTSTSTTSLTSSSTTTWTAPTGGALLQKRNSPSKAYRRDPYGSRYLITSLSTKNLKMGGSVPSGLGYLVNLVSLDLSGNNYTGYLPLSLGGLSKLTYLNLDGNKFSGIVPPALVAILAANGGSIFYGTTCMSGNPLAQNAAGCGVPALPGTNCFDLSRDDTFISPVYDGAWLAWSRYQGQMSIKEKALLSTNPLVAEYLYQQFLVYTVKVKKCMKKHPEFQYYTYWSVHPSPSAVKKVVKKVVR